jgi:hypothetical protein
MKRYATILLALSLGFAACVHDYGRERGDGGREHGDGEYRDHGREHRDVASMQNDGPVVSPWYGPVPNDAVYGGGPGNAR